MQSISPISLLVKFQQRYQTRHWDFRNLWKCIGFLSLKHPQISGLYEMKLRGGDMTMIQMQSRLLRDAMADLVPLLEFNHPCRGILIPKDRRLPESGHRHGADEAQRGNTSMLVCSIAILIPAPSAIASISPLLPVSYPATPLHTGLDTGSSQGTPPAIQ